MSTDEPKQDFIFAITHAAVRLFALWLFISALSGLIFAFDNLLTNATIDRFNVLAFIHYALYFICAYVFWYLAADIAAKVLPKTKVSEPKTDPLNLLALLLAAIGTYLVIWSVPIFLASLAQILWGFGADNPPGTNPWANNGFLEHVIRMGIGLWLIRARFPVAQWLLKLRRIHAD